ncbi:MAG: hypothetical protein K2N79_00730 [Muribaculaceae bacterium]|nr:hypothetical protein [Muribaculaceae bacterium]MDE7368670.1 hypothetical protein [Muribaculaceae bacterium]
MNIYKSPVFYKRPLHKEKYFMYGNLELPHHIKAYIDNFSYEFQKLSDEERLLDLGFTLLRGYNIKKNIQDWLKNHPEISEDSIVSNIGWLLLKFHDVDKGKILTNMNTMNLSQMIDYFKPLLLNCYSEDNKTQMFDDNDIANTSRHTKGIIAGHYLGEVHPNGKWQWTEYKLNKFDWRTIK